MSKRDRPSQKDQYRRQDNRNDRDSYQNNVSRNDQSSNGLSEAQTSVQSSNNERAQTLIKSGPQKSPQFPIQSPSYSSQKKQPHPLLQQSNSNPPKENKKNSNSTSKSSKKYERHQKSQEIIQHLMEQVQLIQFNTDSHDYFSLKNQFTNIVKTHIRIVDQYYLQHKDFIGEQLLKNGLFHQMWGKVVHSYSGLRKDPFNNRYYTCYIERLQKNHSSFQSTFNPIQSQPQLSTQSAYQKYIQAITQQYNTTYTITNHQSNIKVKKSCAQLYQKVQKQMQKDEQFFQFEKVSNSKVQSYNKDFDQRTAKYLLADKFQIIQNKTNLNDIQMMPTFNNKQTFLLSQKQIRRLTLRYKRQRSPQTLRFRLFQQSQPNQRRHKAQLAIQFLQIPCYYQFLDLQILQILQTLVSPTQQIVILKAYTCEFCPLVGKMMIQPKVKLLISAYKFLNLQQLIRFEGMYGKFDGMVVYRESFDFLYYIRQQKKKIEARVSKVQHKIQQQQIVLQKTRGLEQVKDQSY